MNIKKFTQLAKLVVSIVGALAISHAAWSATSPAVPTNIYEGLDVNFDNFQHLQFEMPSVAPKLTPDGYVMFKGVSAPSPTSANYGIYMDPVYFIAAFKFCEYLTPRKPTPFYGSTLTSEAIKSMANEMTGDAIAGVASAKCFQEVAYRTACPKNGSSSLTLGGTGGTNCNSQQAAMCHHLKDAIPDGLGISDIGDPEAKLALAQCDTYGLSTAMFDKIYANKLHDSNYAANLPAAVGGDIGKAEDLINMDKSGMDFHNMIEQRLSTLVAAIDVKATYDNGLKIDKQNQMLAEQNELLKTQVNKLAVLLTHESPVVANK